MFPLEFCLREDLNKTAQGVVVGSVKVIITNYPGERRSG
jgi:hypothetical protein